jgi:hypothetical protein
VLERAERSLRDTRQWLAGDVQELPILVKITADNVIGAGHSEYDLASVVGADLKDLLPVQSPNQLVVPVSGRVLGERDCDLNGIRRGRLCH